MPRYTRPTARASLIAEIPHDERPRERLLRKGPQSLSDAELVAILLRNGRPGASVLEVAREVLAEAGGLTGLSTACTRSLRRCGVGEVKIATLLAAVEIACRMAGAAVPEREVLSKPEAVARYVYLCYGRFAQEVMGALYVCTRHRLLGERELFRGTLHRTSVEPPVILREGLLLGAAGDQPRGRPHRPQTTSSTISCSSPPPVTRSRATVTGSRKRRGPAEPGFR